MNFAAFSILLEQLILIISALVVSIIIYIFNKIHLVKSYIGGKQDTAMFNTVYEEMKKAERAGPQFSRLLAATDPQLKYMGRSKSEHRIGVHWGQRKLMLSEMEVLNEYYFDYQNITMIYVGSASGDHLPLLSCMYPRVKFILYDPRDFNKALYNAEFGPKFEIHKQFFLDKDAAEIAERIKSGDLREKFIIFVSDIRSVGRLDANSEADIARDMQWQAGWVKTIRPDISVLKFRPSYFDAELNYLKGDIHLQAWAPLSSTETRLWVKKEDIDTPFTYHPQVYNDQLYYFNRVKRHLGFKNITQQVSTTCGYDQCHDCAFEIDVLSTYEKRQSKPDLNARVIKFNNYFNHGGKGDKLRESGHGVRPDLAGSARLEYTRKNRLSAAYSDDRAGYDLPPVPENK